MSEDLQLLIAVVARMLRKRPDEVIEEATRLFCRSIVGKHGQHRSNGPDPTVNPTAARAAAKRAKDSPGSVEGRMVAFVTTKRRVSPGDLAEHVGLDINRSRRVLNRLVAARKLKVSGFTASRRVELA